MNLSPIKRWHPAVFLEKQWWLDREFYIYIPRKSSNFGKQESGILVWGRLRRPEDAGSKSWVSRGLVPGGLRRPGTQSVCVRQDRGWNRPENWLSRFLVPDQSGTVWGHLRRPEASWGRSVLNPRLQYRPSIPAHFCFFSTDCARLRVPDRIGP